MKYTQITTGEIKVSVKGHFMLSLIYQRFKLYEQLRTMQLYEACGTHKESLSLKRSIASKIGHINRKLKKYAE